MQLSGRSYIFVAATLLLLATALKFYADYAATEAGQARLFALKIKVCNAVSVDLSGLRMGCDAGLITDTTGAANIMPKGGGSTIQMGK